MKITSVQIELAHSSDRLRAFCKIVFDEEFVVNDIRLLEGEQGFFLAMPSRRITVPCQKCSEKNHLAARFCNNCGAAVSNQGHRMPGNKAFADVAHPINAKFRSELHDAVLAAYAETLKSMEKNAPHSPHVNAPPVTSPGVNSPHMNLSSKSTTDQSMAAE